MPTKTRSTKTKSPRVEKSKKKKKKASQKSSSSTPTQSSIDSTMMQSLASLQQSQQSESQEPYNLDEILSSSYIEDAKSSELLDRLKMVSKALSQLEQPSDPNEVPWSDDEFVQVFVTRKFLHHKDPEIALRVSLILVDILRITVPTAPYSESQLKEVFKLFIRQLKGLAEISDSKFAHRFYLLERLAVVKMFVLLTEPALRAESILEDMFQTFFEVISDKHQQKTQSYMVDIMSSVIEAVDDVTEEMLKILLEPLLAKKKEGDEGARYNLSRAVLERTVDYIVSSLSTFINKQIADIEKGKKKHKSKRARVFKSLVELNSISSKLLLYIIPSICGGLKEEDTEERAAVVKLFATMFAAKDSTLARDYPHIFGEFLLRFNDKEPGIRTLMTHFAREMLKNHPSTAEQIVECLKLRILDTDEKVRRNVVETICDVATTHPDHIDAELLQLAKDRTRDKKLEMRVHTIVLLSKLYRHHALRGIWTSELSEKLEWIPSTVLRSDIDKVQLFGIILEHLLPRSQEYATIRFYTHLDNAEKGIFKRMLQHSKRYQERLREYIDWWKKLPQESQETETATATESEESQKKKEQNPEDKIKDLAFTLTSMIPDRQKGKTVWKEIKKREDVIKILEKMLAKNESQDDINKLRKEIENLVESEKSDIPKYLLTVMNYACYNVITQDQIKNILTDIPKDTVNDEIRINAITFVEAISEIFPELFEGFYNELLEVLSSKNKTVVNISLKILANIAKVLDVKDERLKERLTEICEKGKSTAIGYAVAAAASIYKEELVSEIYAKLIDELEYGEKIVKILAGLESVAEHAPEVFVKNPDDAEKVISFVFDEIVTKERNEECVAWDKPSRECKAKVRGINLLALYLIAIQKEGVSETTQEWTDKIFNLLLRIVSNKGILNPKEKKNDTQPSQESKEEKEKDDKMVDVEDKKSEEKKEDKEMKDSEEKDEEKEEKSESKETEEFDENPIQSAKLRLAAVQALLRLGAFSNSYLRYITRSSFIDIAYTIVDEFREVREGMLTTLAKNFQFLNLPLNYAAIVALAVGDEDPKIAITAKVLLRDIIGIAAAFATKRKITLEDQNAHRFYPEYILTSIIHLTAHFPTYEEEKKNNFLRFQKIYFAYFDAVLIRPNYANVPFFNSLIQMIKFCDDAHEPGATKIWTMADLAFAILRRCAESASPTSRFPGKIYLPKEFIYKQIPAEMPSQEIGTIPRPNISYLPQGFKLNEKAARHIGTPQRGTPTSAKKGSAVKSPSKKSTGKKSTAKKSTQKKSKRTPKRKRDDSEKPKSSKKKKVETPPEKRQ